MRFAVVDAAVVEVPTGSRSILQSLSRGWARAGLADISSDFLVHWEEGLVSSKESVGSVMMRLWMGSMVNLLVKSSRSEIPDLSEHPMDLMERWGEDCLMLKRDSELIDRSDRGVGVGISDERRGWLGEIESN